MNQELTPLRTLLEQYFKHHVEKYGTETSVAEMVEKPKRMLDFFYERAKRPDLQIKGNSYFSSKAVYEAKPLVASVLLFHIGNYDESLIQNEKKAPAYHKKSIQPSFHGFLETKNVNSIKRVANHAAKEEKITALEDLTLQDIVDEAETYRETTSMDMKSNIYFANMHSSGRG